MNIFSLNLFGIRINVGITFLFLLGFLYATTGSWLFVVVLALSLVGHEMSHMIAARYYEIDAEEMHLFFIGGAAMIDMKRATPKQDLVISSAGPIFNFVIGGITLAIVYSFPNLPGMHEMSVAMLGINFGLGMFNLLPAYPMDGGRILRAVITLLGVSKDKAMNVSHWLAGIFSVLFIVGAFHFKSVTLPIISLFLIANIFIERIKDE